MRLRRLIFGLLLVYQAFFLNVFLPGHVRGSITLVGKRTTASCCSEEAPRRADGATAPSQGDKANCAVCHFAAGLIPVPPLDLTLPPLGLLDVLPPPTPIVAASVEAIRTYLACGPPPACV